MVNPGYWRDSINSSAIYKCKNTKACVGGFESKCQLGFEGILCNTCVFNSTNRFFKNFDDLCYVCENAYYSYFIIFALFLFLIVYQTITIRIKMKSKTYFKSCIMKILLNYLQLVNIIDSFEIEIPDSIVSIFRIQSSANSPKQALFPLNCVYAIFNSTDSLFLLNSIFICVFSIFYPLLVCCFLFLRSKYKKFDKSTMKYVMSISVLVVCYTLQPFFLNFFFSAFNCNTINDKKYLDDFLTQECWDESHMSVLYYMIIPFLFLWLFFLPGWALLSLKRDAKLKEQQKKGFEGSSQAPENYSTKKLEIIQEIESPSGSPRSGGNQGSWCSNNKTNPYSFITDGYSDKTNYWEFIIMIQKVLVIISVTFIHNSNALLCLFLFMYFLFIIIQIVMKPFATETLNSLQLYGYFTNFLIIFFCLCYKFKVYDWEALFYLFLIILGNLLFLGFWGGLYIYSSKELFLKIRSFIANKCPILLSVMKRLFHNIIDRTSKSVKSPKASPHNNKSKVFDVGFVKGKNKFMGKLVRAE